MRALLACSAVTKSCIDRAPRCGWLGVEDSNLGSRIQSPLSYR